MKIALISLGCHKNLVDSENMLGILVKRKNLKITNDMREADIAIINTCGFINDAKAESIESIIEIGDYKKEGRLKKLIVTGCLSQRYAKELMEDIEEIDALLGTGEVDKIGDIIDEILKSDNKIIQTNNLDFIATSELERILTTYPHTAYLKIAEGCDNCCTYCVIPSLRGKYRSRTIEDIVKEAEKLSESGVRELSIIAQDTTEYGIDIYGKRMLPKLLKKLAEIESIRWIRVFYTYPDNFSDELLEVLKNEPKICKYIDIPIQHISDKILDRMNRRGNSKKIISTLYKIRENIPDAVFRTSVIVGFPGETDEEYEELKDFMEEFQFDYVGIFKYSREEDTPAHDFENQIDEEIKESRWQELMDMQRIISENKNEKYIGKQLKVIIDGISEESEYMLEGRTMGQALEIDGKVLINDGTGKAGEIVTVEIEENFDYDLLGGIVKNEFTE